MTIDLTHISWHDVFLLGVIVGMWINAAGRRRQGERLGAVEKAIAKLAGTSTGDKP